MKRIKLPRKTPLKTLMGLASGEERKIYIVGGTVRDYLLKRPVKDLDLVVSGDLTAWIQRAAQALKSRVVTMGKDSFQTYRIPIGKEEFIDIWELKKSTLEEDAWRRDFTINAIYYDLQEECVIDPVLGEKDIKMKRIRTLSLNSFQEDPIRMLRAIRFKVVLPGFSIERNTFSWLKESAYLIGKMPGERISAELDLILSSPSPSEGVFLLDETGLLEAVLPEITSTKGVSQNVYHIDDVFNHTLDSLRMVEEALILSAPFLSVSTMDDRAREILLWSLLLHDAGKPSCKSLDDDGEIHFFNHDKVSATMAQRVGRRLKWPKRKTERVSNLIRNHLQPLHLSLAGLPERGIRRLIHRVGDDLPLLLVHYLADRMSRGDSEMPLATARTIMDLYERCREETINPPSLVSGEDVMDLLQVGPGPDVGKILASITRRQVEGEIHTRDEALAIIRNLKKRKT